MVEMVGASLTEFTVTRKLTLADAPPSFTVTVRVALPNWLAAGVAVTVRFAPLPPKTMLPLGIKAEWEDVPTRVKALAGVSASPTTKGIAVVGVSSLIVWSVIVVIVGGVFGAELTVSRNDVLAFDCPSLTVSVILLVPVWPAAGVTVTVRLDPLPPKTMFALGTKVRFVEVPLTKRLPAAVSASPTVNASGPTAVPTVVV